MQPHVPASATRYFSANALPPCSSYVPKYSVDRLVGIEARRMFTDKAWIMLPAKATVDYSPSSTGTDPGTGLDCGTSDRFYVGKYKTAYSASS